MGNPKELDYYNILEINRKAKPVVVNAAYRALMKEYYPNGISGDDTQARLLNEAHKVLSDPIERAKYDSNREKLGGKIIGDYRILNQIGEGTIGKTYKAEHILTKHLDCIKHCSKINPFVEQILIEEANALANLRHHALPSLRGLFKLGDRSLVLAMSYIEGPTLVQVIEKNGSLDPEHVAWITDRMLNALMYMHYEGVIHGDIKPQNIIVQPQKHMTFLVDFGLSAIKPEANTDSKGFTKVFSPPEQINREPILPESDFYSLGMTMIYALNGSIALTKDRQVPINTPEPLVNFIKKLVVRDIKQRPKWEDVDLCDTITKVRVESFGRERSSMKPITGFS